MRWILPLLGVLFYALQVYLFYTYSFLSINIALTEAAINTALAALGAWGILLIVVAYPTNAGIMIYALACALMVGMAIGYIDALLLKWSLGRNVRYNLWLTHSLPVRYAICCIAAAWAATYIALYKKTYKLEQNFKLHESTVALHREAELYKLRQQLQPHFLYNSLNSINALIQIDADKAQEMIGKLSDFLRSSVKREGQERIAVAEELQYIEAYLSIEATRFGDRLQVQYNKGETTGAEIPPFLLQPVLENAIKFGLYGNTGNVSIAMHIGLQDDMLIIAISNPFDLATQPPRGTGFGLEGIRRRLYLLYARADLLETIQEANTFTTVLKIPQAHV